MPNGVPISFGDYTFPLRDDGSSMIYEFHNNFTNSQPNVIKLPGADGGWDEDGDSPSPTVIGSVQINMILVPALQSGMDALRDALKTIASYGYKQLIYRPTDGSTDRYCWAKVNNIDMPVLRESMSEDMQECAIYFTVSDPHWYVDSHTEWEDGAIIDAEDEETTQDVTHDGTAYAIARIVVTPGTGDSCENPTIERVVDGVTVDRARYTGVLEDGDEWVIDGTLGISQINAVDQWDDVTYIHPDFFRLAPGVNSIRVRFANSGDAAEVRLLYPSTFR